MSYWACEFDVSHLISPYPRINKFHPAFFTKFRVLFFSSDHSIIFTSTNSTYCGSRDSFTKQSIFFRNKTALKLQFFALQFDFNPMLVLTFWGGGLNSRV